MQLVLHPTDFSPASEVAFAHALALALVSHADLSLMHVAREADDDGESWERFPAVRDTLSRWGLLPEGAERGDVARALGVAVRKVAVRDSDPAAAILSAVEAREPDIVVLASHERVGAARFFARSVSSPVARQSSAATLVVPEGTAGFVDPESGAIKLRRVLAAVDETPDPRRPLMEARRLMREIAPEGVELELFHAGDASGIPDLPDDAFPRATVKRVAKPGPPVETILARAVEIGADLIVLVTEGRTGLLDALRGSVTERILARTPCPVLAVPAE